jgi:hypothetical protein
MDQGEAYRRVWQTFRTFARVADGRHDDAAWRGHGGVFAVCVARVPAPVLEPALSECRAALGRFPFVRLHPDSFLHISLQELGFVCEHPRRTDEIAPSRLEEFATAAAGAVGGYPRSQSRSAASIRSKTRSSSTSTTAAPAPASTAA